MDWTKFIIFIVTVAGMFFWNRPESSSDRRDMQATLEAIHLEMKDFHGRLCTIEERNKKDKFND